MFGKNIVNEVDVRGWTPLHEAAKRGSLEAIKFLLDQGADADMKSLPTAYYVPDALKNIELTAVDLALHQGSMTYCTFMQQRV